MHTAVHPGAPRRDATTRQTGRSTVAIAGATGYAGQELLRLLARHPAVTIAAAMSSGATASRRLPALSRVWTGEVQPLSADALTAGVDVVFLALPDAVAAEQAPRLVDAGVRVIDLSGAFRLGDGAARAGWYP